MKNEPFVDELAMAAPSGFKATAVRMVGAMVHRWDWAMVVILALLVWAPRFSGPIDLRWDAGVYYLLGTSLAKGEGYRISSEPGAPEALQYPPLLPALVALHQWALGTTDPSIVAPWLRSSYAALFVAYSLVVLALAKRHLSPGFGLAATALCLLNMMTIFLSDLLFAELPFAVVSVVFALVAASGLPPSRPWVRETASFALAAAGFFLRTMGVALLAAWVMEALIRRRWRLAVLRAAFALLPIVLWQAHVARVRASDEYRRPAYNYQRAPYQYYNVSYAENVLLIDPFRPELGRINPGALAARLGTNLGSMPAVLGEATTATRKSWQSALERTNRLLGHHLLPVGLAWVPILGFGTLVVAGVVILARRGAWLMVFIILGSLGLVCTTPWPAQFTRYLAPLAPFLTIAAVLALSWVGATLRMRELGWASTLGRVGLASVLALAFIVQAYAARWMFHLHQDDSASRFVPAGSSADAARFFFHNRAWQAWEEAVAWIEAHASPDAIVATASPHLCYLLTGRHAVLPPMESDPGRARRLLEAVPVSYVIVDELEFVDISRRYALPAMESDPTGWRLTHSIGDTRIYGRTAERTDPSTM
jgi:hypothetical protein